MDTECAFCGVTGDQTVQMYEIHTAPVKLHPMGTGYPVRRDYSVCTGCAETTSVRDVLSGRTYFNRKV